MVATTFVAATRLPAKFGAMSIWFAKKPQYIPPMQVTPIVINRTASMRLHPMYDSFIKHSIGTRDATINTCDHMYTKLIE